MPQSNTLHLIDNNIRRRHAVTLVLTSVGGFEVLQHSPIDGLKLIVEHGQILAAADLFQTLSNEIGPETIWFGETRPLAMTKTKTKTKTLFVNWDRNCPPKFAEEVRKIMHKKEHQHG